MSQPALSGKTVLLVEDDPDDAFSIKRALEKIPGIGAVQHCKDGHEATSTFPAPSSTQRRRGPIWS